VRQPWLISIFAIVLFVKVQAALPAPTEISFECREGLIWIKATTLEPATPVNLLLDTGASVSVINTTAAKRLRLKFGHQIAVRGVETAQTGYALKPLNLKAEDFQLSSPALAVDLQTLSSSCAQPVDGLLGADFFRGRVVQIDFEANKLRIIPAQPDSKFADSLPLQLRPCGMRVPITVNGRKAQWVRLDTGCVSDLQWVTWDVQTRNCSRKTAIGLTETSIRQTETTVQIGSHQFQNVTTGLHDKAIFDGEAGLLGNGLLSRFSSITIDAKSGRLFLQPRVGQ